MRHSGEAAEDPGQGLAEFGRSLERLDQLIPLLGCGAMRQLVEVEQVALAGEVVALRVRRRSRGDLAQFARGT